MELPFYCIVGARPVKAIETEDGGMDILAYNWQTGEFERDMQYLDRIVIVRGEMDVVTEEEFEQYVDKLRRERNSK